MTSKTPKTDALVFKLQSESVPGSLTARGIEIADSLFSHARELEAENVAMSQAITSAIECIVGLDLHLENNHGLFILLALDKLQPFAK